MSNMYWLTDYSLDVLFFFQEAYDDLEAGEQLETFKKRYLELCYIISFNVSFYPRQLF